MKKLSKKEEEVMSFFWDKGALFVKEICEFYPDPKPHFNTISTYVRVLEEKGLLSHKTYGNTYQYYPLQSRDEYSMSGMQTFMKKFFGGSPKKLVSALIEEESLSIDELKELIQEVEKSNQK